MQLLQNTDTYKRSLASVSQDRIHNELHDQGATVTASIWKKILRFGVESCQEEYSSIRTTLWHTRQQWPWLLSRNVDSNLSKTNPILLIWLPLPEKKKEGHNFARDDDVTNAVDHFPRDQNVWLVSLQD